MWYAIVDWGMGMKDEIARDDDHWQLFLKVYNWLSFPLEENMIKLQESKGESAIMIFYTREVMP